MTNKMNIFFMALLLLSLFFHKIVFSKKESKDVFSTKYKLMFEEIFGKNYKENIFSKPKSVTENLDCEIKKLAYQLAEKLNAGEGSSDELLAVFEALQLESCDSKFTDKKKYKPSEIQVEDPYNIFVDNVKGQLFSTGKFDDPFRDIQSAINECQKLLTSVLPGKCVVNIRGGVYNISSPLLVSSSNLVLTNYKDEKVHITSDVYIQANWKLFQSSMDIFLDISPIFEDLAPKQNTSSIIYLGYFTASQCKELCEEKPLCSSFIFFDDTTKDFANQCYIRVDGMWNTKKYSGVVSGKKVNIYAADLSAYQLPKFDQMFFGDNRFVKARFPNANPETQGLHTFPTGYIGEAASWLQPKTYPSPIDIKIQEPSRPNSYFSNFFVGIDGTVSQFHPPKSYWGSSSPVAGGIYNVPSGLQYFNDSEFNFRTWRNPNTGVIHAFHGAHWGNWMFKLDTRSQYDQMLQWSWGGFQEARGAGNGAEWYVENIFEELDVANEWFYDEEEKVLYFFPNVTENGEFILPEMFQVPQLPSLLRLIGTKDNPITNTAVHGLTFFHTTQTFLEPYQVPSGGDWSVHPNGAVFLEGTVGVNISNCVFNSPGGNGIFVKGFHRNLTISYNTMFRLGDNGIVLVGQSNLIDGSDGDHPVGTTIFKNVIFENGIWGKQTYAFVQSVSRGTTIDSNVFFNGPRAGININDGFGGGNLIQNNLLFNFVRETDDHGPINTWDRVPYLTRTNGTVSLDVNLNRIYKNFLINNYRSVWPIDHDDGSSHWLDSFNYLVYGGFKDYLGHDLNSQNNIYIYPKDDRCASTVGQMKYVTGYNDTYFSNICVSQQTTIYNLGSCNPNDLSALIPLFANNVYFTPTGSILANCGGNVWNLTMFQQQGMEKGTKTQTLPTDDVIIDWGKELFGL